MSSDPASTSFTSPASGVDRAEKRAEDEEVPVAEIIEQIGFGWSQVKASCVGGGIWLSDGAELLLISAVTNAVSKEWELGAFQRGFVVSIVFFGIFCGNICSGPIGDNFGRRMLLVASFAGIFVFSILSAMAVNYISLCCFRCCVGVVIGLGQPAWSSLSSEICPSHVRAAMMATSLSFFVVGECYSALLVIFDDSSMKHLHWRLLLQLGAIPSLIFFFLAINFLRDSPIYLAHTGQPDAAKEVLEIMRDDNGAHHVRVRFSWKESSEDGPPYWSVVHSQLGLVFGRQMRQTTLVVMFSCFVLNLNYYGCMYAFPQILPNALGGSAAMQLLFGALWEFPGNALGCLFGLIMPRKRAIKIYLALSSIALVAFPLGLVDKSTWLTEVMKFGGFYGIKCFVSIGFVIIYQYATEVYPTEARITGAALNLGAGRLAAMSASLIYEGIASTTNFRVFFYGIAVFCVFNAVLVDFLEFETMGVKLKDSIRDTSGKEPKDTYGTVEGDLPARA